MTHDPSHFTPVQQRKQTWKVVGPGLVAAATGVGAGDLAATLVAGSQYGYMLLWAAIVGAIVKIALAEGAARWHLATNKTIFQGWWSLGAWAVIYFGFYIVVWGFSYGAAAMSSTGLPLHAMFPALSVAQWGMISGVLGAILVLLNRYAMFEKIVAALVGLMFITVVGTAIAVTPNIPDLLGGLVPRVPSGAFLNTLGLIGGVGGTITMAAYGYWVHAKGWRDASWMRVMRIDNTVAYVLTGLFVICMLVVGAELLHSAGIAVKGEKGLVSLGEVLDQRYGPGMRWMFLIGFWSASFTSILGVWNGVSLLFADFAAGVKAKLKHEELPSIEARESVRSPWFIAYVLWLTIPPMTLLSLGEPVTLIIIYGALGAAFMPFLAFTLIWLLNSDRVSKEWRNGWLSNVVLAISGLMFLVLCVQELIEVVTENF